MKNANYRKHNDGSLNSSTYHKKDGTEVRAILKREMEEEIADATSCSDCCFWGDSHEWPSSQDRTKVQTCNKRALLRMRPPETPASFSCSLFKQATN
jgi:hypothetical protein